MHTPDSIKDHAPDYTDQAWKRYTPTELAWWVHLFVKRAGHRTNLEKRAKDLHDARHYYEMLGEHIKAAEAELVVAGGTVTHGD